MNSSFTKRETGLSLLSRLVTRPSVDDCLGPGLQSLDQIFTDVHVVGEHQDSVTVATRFMSQVLTNVILVSKYKHVIIGGCDAGAVVVDCSHQMKSEQIAALLQRRVRKIAENHYRGLKDAGVKKEERESKRLTSADQWEIVKTGLSRFYLVNVYSPENLEITLLSLNDTLLENPSISAIFILGANAFYHQVQNSDGIGYQSYLRRLRHLTIDSLSDNNQDQVRILFTEPNIFGENCELSEEKKDTIVILNNEETLKVKYLDSEAKFQLDEGEIKWL